MTMTNHNEIRIHGHVIRRSAMGARWEVWRGGQVVGRKVRLADAIITARGGVKGLCNARDFNRE